MMKHHPLHARVEGTTGDGSFGMVLATEGEASDGDILSIAGGQIPERMPMLLSHWNDPSAVAGSITHAVKHLKEEPRKLRAQGQIELDGDGPLADVRRDVWHMIEKGHIEQVSIRWTDVDGKPPTRRVNLPSDHPFFVDADKEKSQRKRFGYFWSDWRAMEGSIVGIGADPGALIGRADETTGTVRTFWQAMAEVAERDDEGRAADLAAALACLRVEADECIKLGATVADRINAVAETVGDELELEPVELAGRTFFLPADAAHDMISRTPDLEPETEPDLAPDPEESDLTPEPEPEAEARLDPAASSLELDVDQLRKPIDGAAVGAMMVDAIDVFETRMKRNIQSLLDMYTGKVSSNE